MPNPISFTAAQLRAIADALGDTERGLTGSEMTHLLKASGVPDPDSTATKRHRLYNAFAASQNKRQDFKAIVKFIRETMSPVRFVRDQGRYEPMRANLNKALSFAGLAVQKSGKLVWTDAAETLSEAAQRARDLRTDLEVRHVHPDVLRFCREELLHDNYFHAVFEAVKSVADKLRTRTGLTDDGGTLVDRVLGGTPPMLAINDLRTESERSEQRGFVNLIKGIFGMFRNTLAHEAKVNWVVTRRDAEDLLTIVSLIHRRIDAATMPPRV